MIYFHLGDETLELIRNYKNNRFTVMQCLTK